MKTKNLLLVFFIIAATLFLSQLQILAVVNEAGQKKEKAAAPEKDDLSDDAARGEGFKESHEMRCATGEIIVKFKSQVDLEKEKISLTKYGKSKTADVIESDIALCVQKAVHESGENLKVEGYAINAIKGLPEKIKGLVEGNTVLDPVFKAIHRKMRLLKKTEQELNQEAYAALAKRQKDITKPPRDQFLTNVYVLRNIDTKGKGIEEICQELSQDCHIEYAQPNYLNQLYTVPDDPYYSSSGSWGQGYADLWGLRPDKLNCEEAWDVAQGEDVIVAVLDTGLDYNHPDIWDNVWVNSSVVNDRNGDELINLDDCDLNRNHRIEPGEIIDHMFGWDFSGDSYKSSPQQVQPDKDPSDYEGHGTHVSGTIAAVGNNRLGMIGVAPKAKIMPVKIFPNAFDDVCADAIVYASDNGARVLSNSWGPMAPILHDPVIEDAIDHAAFNRNCTVIFAAGNNSMDASLFAPANHSAVISVASIDHSDAKSSFSNFGSSIDICAPGGDSVKDDGPDGPDTFRLGRNILSLRAEGTDMYFNSGDRDLGLPPGICIVGENYYRARGTSMACPHAAGAAALVISEHPDWTESQVRAQIVNTADDIDELNPNYNGSLGGGRIDTARAVTVTPYPLFEIVGKRIDDLSGNGNGYIEPGETIGLFLTLKNAWLDATDVNAVISTTNPYVSIDPGSSGCNFGNLLFEGSAVNTAPFEFNLHSGAPVDEPVEFNVDITAAGGYTSTVKLPLFVTRPIPEENPHWTQFHKDSAGSGHNRLSGPGSPLEKKWTVGEYGWLGFIRASPVIYENNLYIGSDGIIVVPWGYSIFRAVNTDTGMIKWDFYPMGSWLGGSPAVFKDEDIRINIIFGDSGVNSGFLYCLIDREDHTELRWVYDLQSPIASHVAISDRYVYVVSGYNILHCVDRDTGAGLWTFDTSIYDSGISGPAKVCGTKPAIDPDTGDVFIAGAHLFCIAPDGSLKWKALIGTTYYNNESSPCISTSGSTVFVGGLAGSYPYRANLYAIDKNTGLKKWTRQLGGQIYSSPALADGMVFVGCEDGYLYAISAQTGAVLWKFLTIGNRVDNSPAVSADGVVYISGEGGDFYAIDKNSGRLLWSDKPEPDFGVPIMGDCTSPAIGQDAVYVASRHGYIVKYAWPPTPATVPIVTDDGQYTTRTDQLNASWTSEDNESGITEYRYRIIQDDISTGVVIKDWTSTGTQQSASVSGLSLIDNVTYYFGVTAKNGVGMWSEVGYSDGITVSIPILQGTVKNESNAPLQGVIVKISEDVDGSVTVIAQKITDSQGKYCFLKEEVGQGSLYLLTAGKTGYQTYTENISLNPEIHQTKDIVLVKSIVLSGIAYGPENEYLSGVAVTILESGDSAVSETAGEYHIHSDEIVSGSVYTIRAFKDGYIAKYVKTALVYDDSQCTRLDFKLERPRREEFNFLLKWGGPGSGDGQFNYPSGICADRSGAIYVIDTWNHRIQKFAADGTFIKKWGDYYSLYDARAICSDSANNIYVVNSDSGAYSHVKKYTSDGVFVKKFGGEYSLGVNSAICSDPQGNIYVADNGYFGPRIMKFNSDGILITTWGGWGWGNGRFKSPFGICSDAESYIYVTDLDNNCVQKFTSDGIFVTKWGAQGSGDGQFNRPIGICSNSLGNIYVVDSSNYRVQDFTGDGVFITKFGSRGTADGQFQFAMAICSSPSNNIYVTDTSRQCIQKFGRVSLKGTVLDKAGAPIKGARIQVAKFSNTNFSGTLSKLADLYTDENGNYSTTQVLQDGAYRILATYESLYPEYRNIFIFSNETYTVNFTIRERPYFTGTVKNKRDYSRIGGANVYIRDSNGNMIETFYKLTDSMGQFRIYEEDGIPNSGTFYAVCKKEGFLQGEYKIILPFVYSATNFGQILMQEAYTGPDAANLTVTVKNTKGVPIPSATVTLGTLTLYTPASGVISINGLKPGNFTLSVSKPPYAAERVTFLLQGNMTKDIVLTQGCTVKGTVLDDSTGKAITTTWVTLILSQDGKFVRMYYIPMNTSNYSMTGIKVGSYKLTVYAGCTYKPKQEDVIFTSEGEVKVINFRLVKQ